MQLLPIFFTCVLSVAASPSGTDLQRAASCDDVFKTAVAVWHMADLNDSAGKSRLTAVGNVAVGKRLEGKDLQESLASGNDGLVAQFDGGYLDAGQGADSALNVAGPALTVSVRLRNPSGIWGSPIFSKHGGHDRLVYNLFSFDYAIGFELGTAATPGMTQVLAPLEKIGPRDWHEVVCRYDGARLQMFVDGVLMDEASPKGPLRTGNTVPCLIGAESTGGNVKAGWKGQIDHVAVWNRALSDAEIQRLSGGAAQVAARQAAYTRPAPLLPPPADLYREKLRPQFHFSARQWTLRKLNPTQREEGWMNDPNGLLYAYGEFHLFSQRWARCWIHAVSKDLVHWTELQPAFWDDRRFGTGVQSGGAVLDKDNTSGLSPDARTPPMVAFWSGFDNRSQCLSYSLDKGRTWTKYAKNPIFIHPERDPKVFWYAPKQCWVMVLSSNGSYCFLTSKNLLAWTELKDRVHDSFECPDMFQLPIDGNLNRRKWVLVRGNGRYSVGQFDGVKFTPETAQMPCDLGPNFYATQSWGHIAGQPGRRVQIAWMAGGRYPDMPFNQQMTFPCDMRLRSFPEGLRICRLPVGEIKSLYAKEHAWNDAALKPGENPLRAVSGGLLDIQLQADLAGAKVFGVKCRGQAVTYSAARRALTCFGREAPLDAAGGRLTLRILVDRTSIEVFANDGKVSMSACFLPGPDNAGLELFFDGGSPKIVSMTVHELCSAWRDGKESSEMGR
jgi:sucrose-6-phosphate hydrolase SacC (GH32 family)